MCQVHTGAYVSLLAPAKPTIPLATQERLPRTWYILHVVSITTHSHDRRNSIGKKKKRREKKIKERKEKKARKKTKKERKEKKSKKRQDKKRKQGKEKRKKCNTSIADPRN